MSDADLAHLISQVIQLRRSLRRERLAFFLVALVVALMFMVIGKPGITPAAQKNKVDGDGVLHVRGLVVDDQNGHERVRLGAPLPDPLIHGVRQKRKGVVSGLVITDAGQRERGG